MIAMVAKVKYNYGFLKSNLSEESRESALLIIRGQEFRKGMKAVKINKPTKEGTKITFEAFQDQEDREAEYKNLMADNERFKNKYGVAALKGE